jgi:hypothetical protein
MPRKTEARKENKKPAKSRKSAANKMKNMANKMKQNSQPPAKWNKWRKTSKPSASCWKTS